jgi:hypothetical protein
VDNSTIFLLEQWALWARVGPGGSHICKLNYPSVSTGFRPVRPRSTSNPQISDDLALEVDRTVASLCLAAPDAGKAVCLYFHRCRTYRGVARRQGIDHRRAAVLVKNGVAWISDFLDDPER